MGSNDIKRVLETGWTALKLGLTSFGGPIAHIGYFRQRYVNRLKWLSEEAFADLAALCQFLPGPASSQLGIAIGMRRAGLLGGLAAWLGFTLPSAILLVLFAFFLRGGAFEGAGWLHGLMLAAVAVVAQAVWQMGKTLAPDRPRILMAASTAAVATLWPGPLGQIVPLALCGVLGGLFLDSVRPGPASAVPAADADPKLRPGVAWFCLSLFVLILALLPILNRIYASPFLQLADIGYRAGSLVFGGGHVVLPMLHDETVSAGIVGESSFLAGYGAAQAVPGPLFTFSAYLGAVSAPGPEGLLRAATMLAFIFLPSYLLVAGTLPFWDALRTNKLARNALAGVNASVVGVLLAALYDPVWTGTVSGSLDFAFVVVGFVSLTALSCPPWLLVALAAAGGWMLYT